LLLEWHLPPDYIVNNWTHELLNLMVEALIKRRGEKKAQMPEKEFFKMAGVKYKKHGN